MSMRTLKLNGPGHGQLELLAIGGRIAMARLQQSIDIMS